MTGPAVVALGGGHGLAASLAALRVVTTRLTAVVTVADDGGSSGRLRQELGALPPGDLRMALAALARDDELGRLAAELLQHRFPGDGPLGRHAVGNLVITGLIQRLGDPVAALDALGRLFRIEGRVLPVSPYPMDIEADVVGLDPADPAAVRPVRGQVTLATTTGRVRTVRLLPPAPVGCAAAVAAIGAADWVVVGPGSWFTSVLPPVMVPALGAAITRTAAGRVLIVNLAPQPGETGGFSAETHLEVFAAHAPDLRFDVVVADPSTVVDVGSLERVAAGLGARVLLTRVGVDDGSPRHDPQRLAAALAAAFAGQEGPARWRP